MEPTQHETLPRRPLLVVSVTRARVFVYLFQTSIQSLEKELSMLRKREESCRKEAETSSREKGLQLQVGDLIAKCKMKLVKGGAAMYTSTTERRSLSFHRFLSAYRKKGAGGGNNTTEV